MKTIFSQVLWFEKESDFEDFISKVDIFEDKNWKDWHSRTISSIYALNRYGIVTRKIAVLADDFITWCNVQELKQNKESMDLYLKCLSV